MESCNFEVNSELIMNELRTEIEKKHLEIQGDRIFTSNPDVAKVMREIRFKYQQPVSTELFETLCAELKNTGVSISNIGTEILKKNAFIQDTEDLVKQSIDINAILPYPTRKNKTINGIIFFVRRIVRRLARFLIDAQTNNNRNMYACIQALRESVEQTSRLCAVVQNMSLEQEKLNNIIAEHGIQLQQLEGWRNSMSQTPMQYPATIISDKRYLCFEDQFRGSSSSICERLKFYYMNYVENLLKGRNKHKILDLGCGRGEWLSILKNEGIDAIGIDVNQDMVKCCIDKNLQAYQIEGITYLKTVENASVSLITGFQIIEHISLGDLNNLLDEAYRVLEEGGILILETPNFQNIDVATKGFYMDPTHMRPVSQDYLKFLAEQTGFSKVEIVFWREKEIESWLNSIISSDSTQALSSPVIRTMLESMKSMVYNCPDYALIATK